MGVEQAQNRMESYQNELNQNCAKRSVLIKLMNP